MFALLSRFEIAVTIGVLGAIALVRIARSLAPRRELLVYGAGLGITAVAYVVFGLQRGAPASHPAWSWSARDSMALLPSLAPGAGPLTIIAQPSELSFPPKATVRLRSSTLILCGSATTEHQIIGWAAPVSSIR